MALPFLSLLALHNLQNAAHDEETLHIRLMLRSLTEDGEFARLFLGGKPMEGNLLIQRCIEAAIASGDVVGGCVRPSVAGWFAGHLINMMKLYQLPQKRVIDYGVSRAKLADQAVWFILRGIGMKDESIRKYYPTADGQWNARRNGNGRHNGQSHGNGRP